MEVGPLASLRLEAGERPRPGQNLTTFYWPHFASGAGYTTELTFINLGPGPSVPANLTISLFNTDGSLIERASLSVPYSIQTIRTLGDLFPTLSASQLNTGYVRIDVATFYVGPFGFTPFIAGALRFSAADGSGSAAMPLVAISASDFVYAHVAESAGYYTGLAFLNTNATTASVAVEVFSSDGQSMGTASFTLLPGQRNAELLDQLVPGTAGRSGGWIHITSDQPLVSVALFASNDGLSVAAIPPKNIGD